MAPFPTADSEPTRGPAERLAVPERLPRLLLDKNAVLRKMFDSGVTPDEKGCQRPLMPAAIQREEAEVLHRVVLQERPTLCLQVGFAFGVSALAILTGLLEAEGRLDRRARRRLPWRRATAVSRLVSIDMNQKTWFGNAGVAALRRAGVEDRHELIEKRSQFVLPALAENGLEIDFAYLDAKHTFDTTLLDFWYIDRMLQSGGVVVFNDTDLPAVDRVIRFVQTHRSYRELDVQALLPPDVVRFSDRYFRKLETWEPDWDFYAPF
jgi:predicted O-methyltransferase YrrM